MRQLNYHGDRTGDVVGQVVGPTIFNQWLIVYAADYDAASDMTAAHVRPATQPDFEAHVEAFSAPAGLVKA